MTPWQRAASGPGVLVIGGLLFWAFSWYLDLSAHIEKFGVGTGAHVHGGDAIIRVNFPVTGAPFIAMGIAQMMGTEALLKRGGLLLWAASLLLMADGLAHAFAFNDHLGVLSSAAFFAFLAPAQIAVGVALPFIERDFDVYLALGMAALLGLYVVSRSVTFAALAWPEPVEALDIFSKVVEVMFIVALVWHRRAVAPSSTTSKEPPRAGEALPSAAKP
jgi:hypothetical protein